MVRVLLERGIPERGSSENLEELMCYCITVLWGMGSCKGVVYEGIGGPG